MHALLEGQLDRARLFRTRVRHLQGDASARSYARVLFEGAPGGGPEAGCAGAASALVMDMPRMGDGPIIRDGKTYSEIAHLAEDAGPFVAIAGALRAEGLAAPAIYAFEEAAGMALIEDFGDLTFGAALADGLAQDMLWHAALDVLIHLYDARPPETIAGAGVGGRGHVMPRYDADVMMAEVDLFCSWYWPMVTGETMVEDERGAFLELWREPIGEVAWRADAGERQHWVLRDFHSPNLLWRAEKSGLERVGLIDFQDAQIGHGGYDLMSLCEDARLDVAKALRDDLIARFCASVFDAGAPEGARAFRRGAAILGAQRNTKILGIFARLAMRDGKRRYLDHIPRIRRYLGWDLAHEDLGELRQWFADKLPGPS